MPIQYRDTKQKLIREIEKRVNELEVPISDKSSDHIHQSLLDVHKNTNKAQLLSKAVIMTYNQTKDEKIDPKAVLNTATDSIRIAWNLATGFAFDDSKSLKEKAIGFAKACIQGTMGMCQGALKGYEEGKGFFDTVTKMVAGSFDQGMKGYNRSLATSSLDDRNRAEQIISDIRAEHAKVRNDPDQSSITEARKMINEEEENYIKELEGKLTPTISKEELSKTVRSLELLQLSNAATSLQSTGLSFMHRALLGEQKNVSSQVLEQLGKDTLNVTKNLNQLLDDDKQNLPSKLWTMTKAYADAAQEGIKSFFQGFKGGDLKEKTVNALVSGFSSFMSKFSEALENSNAKKESLEKSNTETKSFPLEDDENIALTTLSPTNGSQLQKIPEFSSDPKPSSGENGVKEDNLSPSTPHN
ncbi:hypothetical protein DGG96_14150 [Legionella qingyii]|uniref:Uncharacterized protein n=1 Tax=Legionella qingyii TaxID=2184757 RepID=A0A317U2L6_9GAMM|nr:hypothetical protein [Legionella qingyii]PWY55047.1 hypothetical protein DGG96_14150 [Legionella qingyii]RUR22665.1 hypothetical protein ELY16_14300 [Legionella qingyii]RUR26349.1 hypothetical protein ELY20_00010 [Legionella qingyii]